MKVRPPWYLARCQGGASLLNLMLHYAGSVHSDGGNTYFVSASLQGSQLNPHRTCRHVQWSARYSLRMNSDSRLCVGLSAYVQIWTRKLYIPFCNGHYLIPFISTDYQCSIAMPSATRTTFMFFSSASALAWMSVFCQHTTPEFMVNASYSALPRFTTSQYPEGNSESLLAHKHEAIPLQHVDTLGLALLGSHNRNIFCAEESMVAKLGRNYPQGQCEHMFQSMWRLVWV